MKEINQNGPVEESSVNAISNEGLLIIVADRLHELQSGYLRCRENALALTKVEEAVLWLSKTAIDKMNRCVEDI